MEAPAVAPRPDEHGHAIAQRSDNEPAYSPLGEWESAGAKGTVRIERCGAALCGYALTEASSRGESVLVNMKPKTHESWTGNIYSRSSGSTYYGTMTLTAPAGFASKPARSATSGVPATTGRASRSGSRR